jgi:hypothetical protein
MHRGDSETQRTNRYGGAPVRAGRFAGWPIVGALFGLLLLLAPASQAAPRAATGNAGLVINFGNGQVRTYCFTVPATGVPALELLQRTGLGLRLDYVSLGAEICAINGTGCLDPNEPCYCQCQGTPCLFWQLAEWRNGRWVVSNLGASGLIARPGSIQGWSWGGVPPPPSGDALCALAVPATATVQGRSPVPQTTAVPPPTHTRPPLTATPRPTVQGRSPVPQPSVQGRSPVPQPSAVPPTPRLAPTDTPAPSHTPLPAPTATALPPAPPTATALPPPTARNTAVPAPAPTDTPLPPAPATDTASSTPAPSATPSPIPHPPASPPASYWFLGVLVLGLLGLIGWARLGRRAA